MGLDPNAFSSGFQSGTASVGNLAQIAQMRDQQRAGEYKDQKAQATKQDDVDLAMRNFHLGSSVVAADEQRIESLANAVQQNPTDPKLRQQYEALKQHHEAARSGVKSSLDLLNQRQIDPFDPAGLKRAGLTIQGLNDRPDTSMVNLPPGVSQPASPMGAAGPGAALPRLVP